LNESLRQRRGPFQAVAARILFAGTVTTLAAPAGSWAQSLEDATQGRANGDATVLVPTSPDGLTADQAAARAREVAPSIQVAEAELQTRIAQNRQTLSRYVPQLALEASYQRRNPISFDFSGGVASVGAQTPGVLQVGACPDSANGCVVDPQGAPVVAALPPGFRIPLDNYALLATLTVPFSDYVLALLPAKRAAEADERSARLRKQAELATVEANARIAYYDWLRARAQVSLARNSLRSAQARAEDAQAGREAGTITRADALGIASLVASSRGTLARAESFERMAEQNLRSLLRWTAPLTVGEDVTKTLPPLTKDKTLESLVSQALDQRHEARALRTAKSASAYAADGARTNLYPRLEGVANVTHANPNQAFFPPTQTWNTSWFIGLNLRWRLDSFLNARALAREIDANTSMVGAQLVSVLQAIELEVRGAWEEILRAEESARLSLAQLEAAEALHTQRVALFRAGEATSTDVVEAEVGRHNAQLQILNARLDERIARARLNRAVGMRNSEQDKTRPHQ